MCNSTIRKSIDQMLRSMFFFQRCHRSFIPEDYSRQRTRMAKSRMGNVEACLDQELED